mmetsp:Transcript_16977/g.36571  ORF Transcript_16977/g.36571 Transcript_16977/m.36571 type:complete len:498 (-) Transcript_16977:102-1595(-)
MAPTQTGNEVTVLMAGMLEKQSRWRKDWNYRFCVVRPRSLDYFLEPPAVMEEDQSQEQRRGRICLSSGAFAVEAEVGRPFCISVGGELLSCSTAAEQRRWLEIIGQACSTLQNEEGPNTLRRRCRSDSGHSISEEPRLMIMAPEESPHALDWRKQHSVWLPTPKSEVTLLIVEGSSATSHCRLPLYDTQVSDTTFGLTTFGGDALNLRLAVRIHSSECCSPLTRKPLPNGQVRPADSRDGGSFESLTQQAPTACFILGIAAMAAGLTTTWVFFFVIAVLLREIAHGGSDEETTTTPGKLVTFTVREISDCPKVATPPLAPAQPSPSRFVPLSPEMPIACATPVPLPLEIPSSDPTWVGKWKLDRARSQVYEPIMSDMGVNYMIRKVMDAKTSFLTLSQTDSQIVILLQMGISVEETIPLDGSWASKAVPPMSKMSGEARWRLSKKSSREIEMYTEFPAGWGTLTDTLTVAEDGQSFARRIARSDTLYITRYFTRCTE